MSYSLPVILAIGGHDPSGGAGIQADIETITSHGCHAVSLITCLTSQNTKDFFKVDMLDPNIFTSQAESLLSDIAIDAIKIGVIGNLKILEEINKLLNKLSGVAVIVDPVIKSTSGGTLTESTLFESLKSLIFPKSFFSQCNSVFIFFTAFYGFYMRICQVSSFFRIGSATVRSCRLFKSFN